MKRKITFVFILMLLTTFCFAEKSFGTYKSSVTFPDTKTDDGRYQVLVESKGEIRFLLCKDYKTASDCYYAIALYGSTDMNCDLTTKIPSVIEALKEQGHTIKVINDSVRGGYHGIAYNVD